MEGKLPAIAPEPDYGSGPADTYAEREAWLSFVRPAADVGKLEKLKTVRARTPQQKAVAQRQNYYLSRKSFGNFSERYNLIDWGKR